MQKMFTFSLGLFIAIFTTSIVNAQLLFNENFTGYSSADLVGQGSWQNAGSGNDVQVTALANNTGALVKAGYTSGTNYITLRNAGGQDPFKNFVGSQTVSTASASTFFVSFLVRVSGSVTTQTTGNALQSVALRTSAGNNLGFFYIGKNGSNLRFGISKGESGSGDGTFSSNNYNFGTTYLVVLRYDIVTGSNNDAIYLWINPTMGGAAPTTASAIASLTIGSDGSYSGNVTALQIFQQLNTATGQYSATAQFDAFKAAYGTGQGSASANATAAWTNLSGGGAPLPVKFSGFDAKKEGSGVKLTWNVETEENLAGYQVERSNDGTRFMAIGTVQAEGRSTYSFTDAQPLTGKVFYRIKSLDIDGKFMYSPIVSLNGTKSSLVLKAFPIPVVRAVTIQHTAANILTRVSISSEDGRLIKSIIPANGSIQTTIDLSSAKPGLYFVRFDNGNGETETLKIMKQ